MTDAENCGQLKQQYNSERQLQETMPGISGHRQKGEWGPRARLWERNLFLITVSQTLWCLEGSVEEGSAEPQEPTNNTGRW